MGPLAIRGDVRWGWLTFLESWASRDIVSVAPPPIVQLSAGLVRTIEFLGRGSEKRKSRRDQQHVWEIRDDAAFWDRPPIRRRRMRPRTD
jgi:hypothetical protein